jgi:tetratricopeptide (TPR) repeat protein
VPIDVLSASRNLFIPASQASAVRDSIALRQLDIALGQFSSGEYDRAIASFKRTISLSPDSGAAVDAYDYLARTYLTLDDSEAAIGAYRKALEIAPDRDDLHIQLGNAYTSLERTGLALAEYELAVKVNPIAANRYSLGQGYLAVGQYDQALRQFEQVRKQEPRDPYGSFGLGQVYAKQEKFSEAAAAFREAIAIKDDYWDAYSELGYVLADSGELGQAQNIADQLLDDDPALGALLTQHIYDKTRPAMTSAYVSDLFTPFLSALPPGTAVSALGGSLYNAGDSQTFSIEFQFSKAMDPDSVENIGNWSIARATGTGIGDGYNYSLALPGTEIALPRTPTAVIYDSTTMTATVLFTITQNATADGTLDPSHISFSFNGTDLSGLSMDKQADSYSGFSSFA